MGAYLRFSVNGGFQDGIGKEQVGNSNLFATADGVVSCVLESLKMRRFGDTYLEEPLCASHVWACV